MKLFGQQLLDWVDKSPGLRYPPEVIEALKETRDAVHSKQPCTEFATRLRESGFNPIPEQSDQAYINRLSSDHWVAMRFWWELISRVWPDELRQSLWTKPRAELSAGDAEPLVHFLELNPFFFRSGYAKPKAISRLKSCLVTESQRQRLVRTLDRLVGSGFRETLPGWGRLSDWATDAEILEIAHRHWKSDDPEVQVKVLQLILVADSKAVRRLGLRNTRLRRWKFSLALWESFRTQHYENVVPSELYRGASRVQLVSAPKDFQTQKSHDEALRRKHRERKSARHRFASFDEDLNSDT